MPDRLVAAALAVAASAATRQRKDRPQAYVPWTAIHELRAALEDAGYNWRQVKAESA